MVLRFIGDKNLFGYMISGRLAAPNEQVII